MSDCNGPVEGIGALTSPCAKGCGVRAPIVRRILADRVSVTSRMAAGQQVNFRLDSVPNRDSHQRIAHLIGFEIQGTLRLATTDTTNDAVPAYSCMAKLGNIFLEDVSGHQSLAAVDGRNLIDDRYFRNLSAGLLGVGCAGLAADVGAAQNNDLDWRLFFPFTPMQGGLRGAIPLKAVKDRGESAFRATVASLPDTYTNVTDSGFTGTVNVFAIVAYLPAMLADSGWQLESYTEDDTSGRLRHADRMHEYIVIRPYESDSNIDLTGYAGVTVQAGNDTIVSAYTSNNMSERDLLVLYSDLDSDLPSAGINDNSNGAVQLIPRAKSRKAMAAGPVTYNYATRADSTTRYLHRTVLCQNAHRMTELGRSVMGCSPTPDKVKFETVNDKMGPEKLSRDPGATVIMTSKLGLLR